MLRGGKRLRPAFAYWGYRGAGGADADAVVRAVAALELVQASALIHDDLMDGSDTRRGEPAVHRRFAAQHRGAGWRGDADGFGDAAAILLGDLCLVWSDEMLHAQRARPGDGGPGPAGVRRDAHRGDVGQYLDVLTQATGDTLGRARRGMVARYKSAKYTVERPLLLGAALAGAPADAARRVLRVRAAARRGVPAARRRARRVRRPGADRQARRRRPARGQADVPGRGRVRDDRRRPAASCSTERLGDPGLDPAGVTALREVIVASGARRAPSSGSTRSPRRRSRPSTARRWTPRHRVPPPGRRGTRRAASPPRAQPQLDC